MHNTLSTSVEEGTIQTHPVYEILNEFYSTAVTKEFGSNRTIKLVTGDTCFSVVYPLKADTTGLEPIGHIINLE